MATRLQKKFNDELLLKLKKDLGLANTMSVPRLVKIVVNSGIGSFRENKEAVENFVAEVASFTGQRPTLRKAKKSEAGFKIRKNDVVGVAVTLRNDKMWAFFDKLINIALPRVRDFKGVEVDAFDKVGNYSLGMRDHTVFPEVNPNTTKGVRSLQITIVTSSKDAAQSKLLLEALGMPFKKEING